MTQRGIGIIRLHKRPIMAAGHIERRDDIVKIERWSEAQEDPLHIRVVIARRKLLIELILQTDPQATPDQPLPVTAQRQPFSQTKNTVVGPNCIRTTSDRFCMTIHTLQPPNGIRTFESPLVNRTHFRPPYGAMTQRTSGAHS